MSHGFRVYFHDEHARVPRVKSEFFKTKAGAEAFSKAVFCAEANGSDGIGRVVELKGNAGDHYDGCHHEERIYAAIIERERLQSRRVIEQLQDMRHEAGNTGD